MEKMMIRRVVTGLDKNGKSCVLVDGPVQPFGNDALAFVWRTENGRVRNDETTDLEAGVFDFDQAHSNSSTFLVMEFPPGVAPMWHATDTIDYCVVLSGEIILELETGDVTLRAGDVAVDRGVVHSWRNEGRQPSRCAFIMIPAEPVGQGRTV